MSWSGFDQTHPVRKQAGVQGISCPGSGRTQPARYQLRSSTDVPDHIVQNQPGSDLVLADCVTFWPNGSGPDTSRGAINIRPASGQRFRADPSRIGCESDPVCLLGYLAYLLVAARGAVKGQRALTGVRTGRQAKHVTTQVKVVGEGRADAVLRLHRRKC